MGGIVKAVRKVGRSVRKRVVPDKVDKAVFGTLANVEDVVRGKTPDTAAEAEREFRAAEGRQIGRLEAQKKEAGKEAKRAQAVMGRRVTSSLRARRSSRRNLMTSDRLGPRPTENGKQTLG